MIRPPRLWLAAALIALTGMILFPARAMAHTRLTSSSPAAGATVSDTVTQLRFNFSEPVSVEMTSVELSVDGHVVARGAMESVPATRGRSAVFHLPATLKPGAYTVAWRAAATDGHVVRGTFSFTVTASSPAPDAAQVASTDTAGSGDSVAAASSSPEDTAEMGDQDQHSDADAPLAVIVRWAEFVALLGMIGAAAFNLFVLRRVRADSGMAAVADRAQYGAWWLAMGAAALSVLTLFARLYLQSVALNGPADAFEGEVLRALLTGTVWGSGWILQAVATLAFVLGLAVSRAPYGRSVGWMGATFAALLAAAVPALSGHAAAVEQATAIAIASDWLHVLGAGVWLGTLAAVLLAGLPAAAFAEQGRGTAAFARLVAAFSPVALAGAGTAGVTGVINSVLHFHEVAQLWTTGYGRALLLKLALLAVVAGIGFYNWRFVTPSLHGSGSPARMRRTAAAELGVGVVVVLVTAVLVALPPP